MFLLFNQGKIVNKPDEMWIMNRLIKQLTDMGFPVWEHYLTNKVITKITRPNHLSLKDVLFIKTKK